MADRERYRVRVLPVGSVEVPGPEIFWMSGWETWHTLSINVVLLQGGGHTVLVNSGAPEDLSPISEVWTNLLGDRAAYRRAPEQGIVAQLAEAGVRPAEVTHLVLTPLQLYTTGGVPLFDNAQICLSRRGWVHFHTTHQHPHDNRWTSISRDVLVHLVTEAWDRVRLLADEDEIVPGVRTWFAGHHHRASIAVEADTTAGTVVASDAFFYYENVEDDVPLGISEDMYEGLACFARTRRVADHILPLYDPKVFQRYPGGLVAR